MVLGLDDDFRERYQATNKKLSERAMPKDFIKYKPKQQNRLKSAKTPSAFNLAATMAAAEAEQAQLEMYKEYTDELAKSTQQQQLDHSRGSSQSKSRSSQSKSSPPGSPGAAGASARNSIARKSLLERQSESFRSKRGSIARQMDLKSPREK